MANSVFSTQQHLVTLSDKLRAEIEQTAKMMRCIHKVMIATGERAIQQQHRQNNIEDAQDECHHRPSPMITWNLPEQLPSCASTFHTRDWDTISKWQRSLQTGNRIYHWSWYQLYVDYTLFSGHEGPWYYVKTLKWEDHETQPGHPLFVRRCRWFSSYLTKLCKCLKLELPLIYQRPDSPLLGFWINTLSVAVEPQRHEAINTWMARWGPTFYVSKDLKAIP